MHHYLVSLFFVLRSIGSIHTARTYRLVLLRTKGTKKYLKICMRRVRRYHNAVYCEQFSYIPSSHEDGFSFCSLTMLAPCALAAPAVLCMIHAYPLIDLAFLTLSLDFAFNCCLDTYAQNQSARPSSPPAAPRWPSGSGP